MQIRIGADVTWEWRNAERERRRWQADWTRERRHGQERRRMEDGERAREGSVCHSARPSKGTLSPPSLWGCPHQSRHLVAASIDHLQSFIPPIKMLSVHITFVFLCWTLLLLHKDTVKKKKKGRKEHGLFLMSGKLFNLFFFIKVLSIWYMCCLLHLQKQK